MDEDPLVVRVPQACRMLSCSHQTLYDLMNAKKIASFTEGRARKIEVASIKAYIKARIAANQKFERPRHLGKSR